MLNRILLIDSNTFFRNALRDILIFKFPSLNIEEAESGTVGLKKIIRFHPQLIFIDIQLPEEDGFKLACRIQADNSSSIVVILSSFDLDEYQTAAHQAGIKHVIPKNLWSGQGILALVEELLTGARKDQLEPPGKEAAVNQNPNKTPPKKMTRDPQK